MLASLFSPLDLHLQRECSRKRVRRAELLVANLGIVSELIRPCIRKLLRSGAAAGDILQLGLQVVPVLIRNTA
mgnify:CR=1 FL=1